MLCVTGNSIKELQYWLVNPTLQPLLRAKVFILGRISLDQGINAEMNPSVYLQE